jgi:hypothetical protein
MSGKKKAKGKSSTREVVKAEVQDEEEDEVEYREVDPMAVIEERIILIESWVEEDPHNDQIDAKHEEYIGLMEELEILGKKMRKTDKLLDQGHYNDTTKAKLQRKRDQYEQEVTDIVLYAEQDDFFDLDPEHAEDTWMASMNTNSLLGQPLETLTEMSGFEDSKAWNDSRSDFSISRSDFGNSNGSVNNGKSPKTARKGKKRLDSSTDDTDISNRENISILEKKLKRAKSMLENSTDDRERSKLLKKITEYKEKLELTQGFKHETSDEDTGLGKSDRSQISDASSLDHAPKPTPIQVMAKSTGKEAKGVKVKSKAATEEEDEGYSLLKKKLSKATKLVQSSSDSTNVKKLQKKIQEYLDQLKQYPAWKKDQSTMGYDIKGSVRKVHAKGDKLPQVEQQQPSSEDEAQQDQKDDLVRRSFARSMIESHKQHDQDDDEDTVELDNMSDHSLNLEKYVQEERTTVKLLHRKLEKVEKMMDDTLKKEGDDARYTKEFRKLQKKRTQYMTELGDDHGSLSSSSRNASFRSESIALVNNTNSAHSQPLNHSGRDSSIASAPSIKPDEESEAELLKKKLNKLEKMMKAAGAGTKEYNKLSKKKAQYQQELARLEA